MNRHIIIYRMYRVDALGTPSRLRARRDVPVGGVARVTEV